MAIDKTKGSNDKKSKKVLSNVIDISKQRENFIFDDDYIKHIVEDPKGGKRKALVKAGYDGDYPAQKAHVMHKRLLKRITLALHEAMIFDGLIGRSVVRSEALNGDSSAVRLSAGKTLLEYAGLKPTERIEIKESQTVEQVDREILDIMKRIEDNEKQA